MGKIVSNFFISLDGVVESPDTWHFPYFDDEMGNAIGNGMETTDALLMGRVLYEEWAGYWPTSDDEPIASIFNNMPKYVVSRTLRKATWNNTTIISGEVAAAIRGLKDSTEGDITMSGSATLVRWLLANGLLDRLNLMVHPDRRRQRAAPVRGHAHPPPSAGVAGDLQHWRAQPRLRPRRHLTLGRHSLGERSAAPRARVRSLRRSEPVLAGRWR